MGPEARREGRYQGEYFYYPCVEECGESSGGMGKGCAHNINNFVMSIGSKIIDVFVGATKEENVILLKATRGTN